MAKGLHPSIKGAGGNKQREAIGVAMAVSFNGLNEMRCRIKERLLVFAASSCGFFCCEMQNMEQLQPAEEGGLWPRKLAELMSGEAVGAESFYV